MLHSHGGNGSVDVPDARGRLTRMMARSSGTHEVKDDVDARAILESLDGAVIARGLDGVIRTWNAGAQRLYGYAASEVLGRPYDLIVPSTRRQREGEAVTALLAARVSDGYVTKRLCKDGAEADVWVRTSPIIDAVGAIIGVSTVEDELSAKDARSTQDVDAYLRSAFADAPIGIALVSITPKTKGRFLQVNRALCELTGYSSEMLQMTDVHSLLHPSDVSTDVAAMTRLSRGEIDEFQLEQRLLHAERHALWVTLSASLVRDAAGNPLYCIRQL